MENNNKIVAITKYDNTINPLRKAIETCQGFAKLKHDDKILIKPNIVWGGGKAGGGPQYGFITTARMVEDIIILLKEKGCNNITIGEGTVIDKAFGSDTKAGFKWSKIGKVAKRQKVKILDLNESPYKKISFNGTKIEVSKSVLDADFLINVPVLKTHSQTKISLGFKNLKGCISTKSRQIFHMKSLPELVAHLGHHIKPDLTVIDGIYGLELGPSNFGNAYRMNAIVAGRDPFSCDIVGASILGFDPKEIPILQNYAEISGEVLDLNSFAIKGNAIEDFKRDMRWEVDYCERLNKANISGLRIQSLGDKICTGCMTAFEATLALVGEDFKGENFDNIEICSGKEAKAMEDSKTVLLLGKCAIAANKNIENAIKIEGCPPDTIEYIKILYGILGKKTILMKRMMKLAGIMLHVYKEDLLRKGYTPPQFDPRHFM